MIATIRNTQIDGLRVLLLVALMALSAQLYFVNEPAKSTHSEMVLHAEDGQADMALRNVDFPNTYISAIDIDLTSPHHWVQLAWSGPKAGAQERGPFHSSPGAGDGEVNCDDFAESNRGTSCCTPKGTRFVEGFSDTMGSTKGFRTVTWFHSSREIGLHSHPDVPDYPASRGCVRLDEHAAQLIHNNAVVGVTKVTVDGHWTRREDSKNAQVNYSAAARNDDH